MSKISLMAFENYMHTRNTSLFENIVLNDSIDKDNLIENILLRSAEFSVFYTDPYVLKMAIESFFKKQKTSIDRIVLTLNDDYNPLHNFDRLEDYSYSENVSGNATGNTGGTTTDFQTSYESNTERETGKSQDSTNSATNTSSEIEHTHTGHLRGNIGLTKSQDMVLDEVRLRMSNNIIDVVTDMFIGEFCVCLYT